MTKLNNIKFDNLIEEELFRIFSDAVGLNQTLVMSKTLEVKKFKKWCKKNYYKIDLWLNNILNIAQQDLCKKGLITEDTKEEKVGVVKVRKEEKRTVTKELIEEAIKLKGLKKFLINFSMISEREAIDVHLWETYLIFAQLFGIAKKVEKQFSKIYPDFNKQAILNTEITVPVAKGMSNICYREMKTGIRMYNRSNNMFSNISSSDYSSGSGGRSYSSGGSSSRGSSGGGFR